MQIEARSWELGFSKSGIDNPLISQKPNSSANPDTNQCSNWHSLEHHWMLYEKAEYDPFLQKVTV